MISTTTTNVPSTNLFSTCQDNTVDTHLVVVACLCCACVFVISLLWVSGLYASWKDDIQATRRVSRLSESSPSNGDIPITTLRRRLSITSDEQEERQSSSRQHPPSVVLIPKQRLTAIRRSSSEWSTRACEKLDFDHVFLDVVTFFKIHLLIFPSLVALAVYGLSLLRIRICLCKMGFMKPLSHDPAVTGANLCLEQGIVINYQGRHKSNRDIAVFSWPNFPMVTKIAEKVQNVTAHDFRVEICLKRKRVIRATLEGEALTMDQCVTALQWAIMALEHPRIHALSNWAINLTAEQKETNPEHAWFSAVTAGYNYFGSGFCRADPTFRFFGHLSPGNSVYSVGKTFGAAMEVGICEHSAVVELIAHSRLVRFITRLRPFFLHQFAEYKHTDFKFCDGEAMFVGTVIHSLDHFIVVRNMKDPLWLDVEDEKFGYMAEILRIAMAGFADDLPFLSFNQRFKGAKHPFFRAVYKEAASIDQGFADQLETCIVK